MKSHLQVANRILYQELGQTVYPSISKSVFIIFMVFVPILLLNMLIAMMGNTYAHVIEQSEKEYTKQWAKIVVTLERAIPQADAHRYLQEYSISLGPSEDPSTEQRAVVVIKLKSKTKAKQRKGSVANWKRVGKVTVNALRKRGLTGEELRCLMWGRESINTPVKVKKRPVDPLTDPKGPNVTGAFGEALTTALDVMAFTHDLDIGGAAQGLNLANNVKPVAQEKNKDHIQLNKETSVSPKQVTTNAALGDSMYGTLNQLKDAQVPTELISKVTPASIKPTIPADVIKVSITHCESPINKSVNPNIIDPLRELVLCSKNYEIEPEKLNDLATQAANLPNAEEISVKAPSTGVKTIAGIFAGTETFVKKIEGNIKKKFAALDPSDSEEFGDAPLLGKISRARRAKSASKKNSSAKSTTSDKRRLVNSESSSSDSALNIENGDEQSIHLDYAEERIRQVKESLKGEAQPFEKDNVRPINIDVAVANDQLSVTISETINVKGEGEGFEVQSSNIKEKRKKRSKTAKTNRVVPAMDVSRGCHSVHQKSDSDNPPESPDPLEPWSTKRIANMNTILAWEDDQDSL